MIYICIQIYVYRYVCVHVYRYVHMCICIYACISLYIYIYMSWDTAPWEGDVVSLPLGTVAFAVSVVMCLCS